MPNREPPSLFPVALCALAVVALILVIAKHDAAEAREELALERARRDELESLAKKREDQLNGALDELHKHTDAGATGE